MGLSFGRSFTTAIIERTSPARPGRRENPHADSATNVNGVYPLSLTVSDPPTQAEMQSLANKLDELINALHR